jgi:tetratricopeptide (TPR) repeat protein
MMKQMKCALPLWLSFAAASAVLLPSNVAFAQGGAASPAPVRAPAATPLQIAPAPAVSADAGKSAPAAAQPDRAVSYYHLALANMYEENAATLGRPEYITQAVEEYKLALNADPASAELHNGLADLYFRTGRIREAEATARELLKSWPDNVDAHKLLGRLYLRQLSEGQSALAPSGNALDQAIAEFEKIVSLRPKSVEDRMVLGQLYTVKHLAPKAEEQFKTAQSLEPDSEEVVLNLARLYAESGDLEHAVKVIEAVPVADRSPRMESALGGSYDQLKKTKEAIAAYRRALELNPADTHSLGALAQALLNDSQFDEALKEFQELAADDPDDATPLIHIAEIQRRQGKYEDALASARKARKIDPNSLEAGYNEGLVLDVLGRFDEAAQVCEKMVELTSHANGAYTEEEKNNRGIFLERLGAVYHEQNKVEPAIAVYQKMIDMGGETALRGFQGQVDIYRDAKLYEKAVAASRRAVEANPKDRDLKLMLAGELTGLGRSEEGIAMVKSLLSNSAEDRSIWLALGQIYVRLRRWKDAEDAFAKASALTTRKEDRTYLLFLKGELSERQKHLEPAEQFFREALEQDPSNAMTLNYYGYMLADKGLRLPEALKFIRKAVELEPINGAYLDSLGWVYFKMGQYELAEENLLQAVERDRTDPTVHDHLGDLYEKTGRIHLAAKQWELSLAEYNKSAPIDVEPGEVAKVQHKLESARVRLAKQESANGQSKPE